MSNRLPLLSIAVHEDDEPIMVRATTRDMVGWDLERSRRKWPASSDAPFLMTSFLGWHALRRIGSLPSGCDKFDDFIDVVASVRADSDDAVDPSLSAASAD